MTKFTTAEAKYLLFQLEFWWEFLKISDDINSFRNSGVKMSYDYYRDDITSIIQYDKEI